MRKRFLMAAATAVFLIPSLSCAIAAGPEQPQGEHYRVSEEDRAAFTDAIEGRPETYPSSGKELAYARNRHPRGGKSPRRACRGVA